MVLALFGLANFLYDCYLLFFWRVWPAPGGIDIALRWEDVKYFFQPGPFYGVRRFSVYPPASYVMLWPLVGWAPSPGWTKLAIAIQYSFLIPALVWTGCKIARTRNRLDIAIVAVFVFTNAGLGAGVKNGQITIHILLLLLAAHWSAGWAKAAVLLTFAMVKPTIAVPFHLPLLFTRKCRFTAILSAVLYAAITFLYKPYPAYDVWTSLAQWRNTLNFEEQFTGYADLNSMLRAVGHADWLPALSVAALVLFAVFLYSVRGAEPIQLFAITAAFARIWGYHRSYDDILLLPLAFLLLRECFANPASNAKWLAAAFFFAHLNIQVLTLESDTLRGTIQSLRILTGAAAIAWLLVEVRRQPRDMAARYWLGGLPAQRLNAIEKAASD